MAEINLSTAIDERLKGVPGKVGLAVLCPEAGIRIVRNGQLSLPAASVIKLPIMAEAFRQFEAGLLDPSEIIHVLAEDKLPSCGALTYLHAGIGVNWLDLVTLMIILSDNTATNLLISRLGQERINALIEQQGWRGTHLSRPLFRPDLAARGLENHVSAADMADLLQKVLNDSLISRDASEKMLSILLDQRLNGKLPFFLHSRGIRVAHKTGEDDGITHDVGILFARQTWIVCFLSSETDPPAAERAMQDIAALCAGVQIPG